MSTTLTDADLSQIEVAVLPWSLGWVGVAGSSATGVRLVHVADDPQSALAGLQSRLRDVEMIDADAVVMSWAEQVVAQLESPGETADVPLNIVGSAFQKSVWKALCEIPPGTTLSYADVARKVGVPNGARAVGLACGSNPLAPMIPCHRVLRSDGSLGGYGFGLDRKRALLAREKG
jgi:AraC family transcriptional regulator, regulatory protein of adaptative response / methylated-DNA-[protein]-cysteine methyltransferase